MAKRYDIVATGKVGTISYGIYLLLHPGRMSGAPILPDPAYGFIRFSSYRPSATVSIPSLPSFRWGRPIRLRRPWRQTDRLKLQPCAG
jgi:hypothetical protein